jgi:hypothetical protein
VPDDVAWPEIRRCLLRPQVRLDAQQVLEEVLPLDDEPSRFARQIVSTRGKFSRASGSSQAKRSSPDRSLSTTYSPGLCPEASMSSARSSGFRLKVGCEGIQPIRADWASRSAGVFPANRPLPSDVARPSAVAWS